MSNEAPMKIPAETSSTTSISTTPVAKPALAERLRQQQQPASPQAQGKAASDTVTISAQARNLAAAATAGAPAPAPEAPEAPAKTTADEQEQRAPERAVAQRQEGAQAAQGRINLLV